MAGNVKLMTSAGGGVVLDTATTTATDVTVKVPVTGVNNGTLVCSDSSGNVGIGTSSPAKKLHVYTAVDTPAQFESSGTTSYIRFANSGASNGYVGYNSSSAMEFLTAGSERMRIDSSGNLFVGTTSNYIASNNKFVITSSNPSAGYTMTVRQESPNTGAYYLMAFVVGSSTQTGYISSNGTSTTYSTSSDYRLKENIQPMQGALAVVQQLNPVTYTWKADGSDGQGFIAHELQAVVPDCVTGEKDAVDAEGNPVYQGIDTSFLSATLTKAIQELSAKNDALEARIAALEAK